MAFNLKSSSPLDPPSKEMKEDGEESPWNCPLCLEVLKCPKLLPCSHTFCEACLKDLVRHHPSGLFPCPSCRERVRVPVNGVSGFKNNFYLQPLKVPGGGKQTLMCKNHEKREVEQYCLNCDACICLKCKVDLHLHHRTEDIENTAQTIKAKLCRDQMGLGGVIDDLKKRMQEFRSEQRAVKDKRAAVEKDILQRHKMMVSVADKCRDEALFSLDTVAVSIDSQLSLTTRDLQKNLDALGKLHKRMEMCVKSEQGGGLLHTAQSIYGDAAKLESSVQSLKNMTVSVVSRPVLHFSTTAEFVVKTEETFLGPVVRMDMTLEAPQITLKEVFRCERQADEETPPEVYSLSPRVDDTMWIAFEPFPLSDGPPAKNPDLYDIAGQVVDTETSIRGRTTFTHTPKGTGMCTRHTSGFFSTYAKSRSLLKLKNNLKGQARVMSVIVKSEKPLKTFVASVYEIKCGPHRAFDVDENEVYYAVMEEPQPPGSQPVGSQPVGSQAPGSQLRKVHLYQQPHDTPSATYDPPSQPFQPSDVCFYRLGGRQVLLVSDEVSDAIHVVEISKGKLEFLRYLSPGNPLLLQPTALNTDVRGRLWVACRNGSVLLCEPIVQF